MKTSERVILINVLFFLFFGLLHAILAYVFWPLILQ